MLEFLKKATNHTYTENGALTLASTESDCLDLFATIGALRAASEEEVQRRFCRAWAENPDLAVKILFFARDVRGGLGERKVFRNILRSLAMSNADTVIKNLPNVAEYGRFDDLLVLMDTPCEAAMLKLIKNQLEADTVAIEQGTQTISLLAKWLPSVNASSKETVRMAKRIARALGMSDMQYRKMLARMRRQIAILENNLREKSYTFDYSVQPSKAMMKYRKAFLRNDAVRYEQFLQLVKSGEKKLNTGTLYPYDVIAPCLQRTSMGKMERVALDTTWNALPDYAGDEDALVVVDGSGSMYGCWVPNVPSPASVAMSLGIYFAQRNKGAFAGHFITFSERPQLVEVKGRDIYDQIRCCMAYNEVANTNLAAVFDLILNTALENKLSQKDMPSTLFIISDMEFDSCATNAGATNFEYAKKQFARHGYTLPRVVFWNVASRNVQQPVSLNEQGVALVSGCTPRLFQMVMSGSLSPYQNMLDILSAQRYAHLCA